MRAPWLPAAAVLAVLVAANLHAARTPLRLDLTSAGAYSLGPESRKVVEAVRRPVTITFFHDLRSKAMQDSKALLEQYAANPLITVRAIDPMLQPAEARRHQVQFAGTTIFESEGRRVAVNGGTEVEFTNGLIRATRQAAQTVCFTDGHNEADPFSLKTHDHFENDMGHSHSHSTGGRALEIHERHGMGMAKDALEALGYQVRAATLSRGPDQLAGCAVVVVAAPQAAFEAAEAAQLREHLASGGRAIVMLEPFAAHGLDGLLAEYGVRHRRALVQDEESHYWTDAGTPAVTRYSRHRITRNLAMTFYPGAAPLTPASGARPAGLSITPLVQTSPRSGVQPLDGGAADEGVQTLMVLATRALGGEPKREAQLVVVGDGDAFTNSFFARFGNGALFLNAVSALAEQDSLIDIVPRTYEMRTVQLTNGQMQLAFLTSTVALPGLLAVVGLVTWRRRR
ncbi:MAG TPA: DUF4350 domain-containing protein [Azospirillum sp.]|nr:DUF4350 domain-containing protein [Azospirillum sp.]